MRKPDREVPMHSSSGSGLPSEDPSRLRQFEHFFYLAEDGIAIHRLASPGRGGRFTEVNPALCRMLGYSREELLRLSPPDILTAEDGQKVSDEIEILHHQSTLRHEKTLVAKDRRRVPVEIVSRRFEQDGQVMVMSILRDISERRRHVEELEAANRRLQKVQDEMVRTARIPVESPNPFLQISTEGQLLWLNEAAASFCHRTCQLEVGKRACGKLLEFCRHLVDENKTEGELTCGGRTLWIVARPVNGYINIYCHDITERKRAEITLRQSEQKFAAFFQHSPNFAFMSKIETGEMIEVNEAYCYLTGYQREELIGHTSVELGILTAEDRQRMTAYMQAYGRIEHEEGVIHTRTGEARSVIFSMERVTVGSTTLFVGSGTDITERKRAEETLRESEAKYRAVFEQAAIGMGRVRFEDARWIDVNDTFCEMLGYRREELLSTPWPQITHPEDVDLDLIPFQQMAAGQLDRYSVEKRFIHKSGRWVWAQLTLSLVRDREGRPHYEIAVIEDITGRKQMEETLRRYELLARHSRDIILFMDRRDGRILEANAAAVAAYGWSRQELLGMTVHDLRVDGTKELVGGQMAAAEERGILFETEHRRKDGSTFPVEVSSQGAQIIERPTLISVIRDITERKRAEAALRELNETLEQRVAYRTAEVQAKAEQLRALAIQLGQAEQQERKRLAKILHDYLQQLIVAARMQLGWMESGSDVELMRTTAQEVNGILQEAIDASRSLAVDLSPPVLHEAGLVGGLNWLVGDMEKKQQFRVHLLAEKQAEPVFEEARILLFECVRELLLNAVKHAGVSEAQVTLERTDDGEIKLTVADEGRGFDPDVLRRRRKDEVSFGLFSIQERLVHIGGQMEIESAPGRGTLITLTVPTVQEPEPAAEAVVAAAGERIEETVTMRHKSDVCRVLIVDDHKILRDGLKRLLRFEPDIEVIGEAEDGPQAIELADKLRPEVVIMDVNLGEMSGVEATRQIVARHPRMRVVGLSMHVDQDVASAMLEAGASAYLTKSGPSEELIRTVREQGCRID